MILWPRRRPHSAQRVCIYRIGNVGDTVCALPAIYAIRKAYPRAHLTLVTSPGRPELPGASELLDGADWLDEIFVYHPDDVAGLRARLQLLRELRRRAFDVWFEIPPDSRFGVSLRNMIAARATGARWGYGWRVGSIRFAVQAQSEFLKFPNEVDRLMTVVREAGIADVAPVFALPLTEEHRRTVDQWLAERSLSHLPMVGLAPAAKRLPNRWPVERFAAVAHHLARNRFGLVVLGGAPDRELCAGVAAAAGTQAVNLAGRASLLETCEALKRCRLLICNDSGVQHMAAAVGTPCVSLFSMRDMRGKWHPYGPYHTVLHKWVDCHTCLLDACPYDNRCIKEIETDEVIAAAERMLNAIPTEQRSSAAGL